MTDICTFSPLTESKYCPLLETESGLSLLESMRRRHVDQRSSIRGRIQTLVQQIVRRCEQFKADPSYQSSDELVTEEAVNDDVDPAEENSDFEDYYDDDYVTTSSDEDIE